jgi:hypothetical protein
MSPTVGARTFMGGKDRFGAEAAKTLRGRDPLPRRTLRTEGDAATTA